MCTLNYLLQALAVVVTLSSIGEESCTETEFRQLPNARGERNGMFIQYCSKGSWHYLCSGGKGFNSTLAKVICRQMKYSDQGADLSAIGTCTISLPSGTRPKAFRMSQACTGMENSIAECGEVLDKEHCTCGEVAEIICQPPDSVTQSPPTTAINKSDNSTDSASPSTTPQNNNTTSIINTALGAVIGVLVALVLISVVCIVVVYMCKKRSAKQQSHQLQVPFTRKNESYTFTQPDDSVYDDASSKHPNSQNSIHQVEGPSTKKNDSFTFTQPDDSVYDDASSKQPNLQNIIHKAEGPSSKKNENYPFTQPDDSVYDDASSKQPNFNNNVHQVEGPSTKKNEYYTFRQLDDPVYDETSSRRPNYSSQGPDTEAANDQATNGYDSMESTTKPKTKLTNPTPKKEPDIYDAGKRPNEVIRANKKKKTQKKSDERNKPKMNAQQTPQSPTPMRDEASKKEDNFYDAEEHTYSVVNKKKASRPANPAPMRDEAGKKGDDFYNAEEHTYSIVIKSKKKANKT